MIESTSDESHKKKLSKIKNINKYNLPEKNMGVTFGFSATQVLRENNNTKFLPIVMTFFNPSWWS